MKKKRYRLKKKVKVFLVIFVLIMTFSIIIPQTWAKFAQSINKKIRVSIATSHYTIVFNGNGATSGSTASVECIYGEDCESNIFLSKSIGATLCPYPFTIGLFFIHLFFI